MLVTLREWAAAYILDGLALIGAAALTVGVAKVFGAGAAWTFAGVLLLLVVAAVASVNRNHGDERR
jgi:hypothetical protein